MTIREWGTALHLPDELIVVFCRCPSRVKQRFSQLGLSYLTLHSTHTTPRRPPQLSRPEWPKPMRPRCVSCAHCCSIASGHVGRPPLGPGSKWFEMSDVQISRDFSSPAVTPYGDITRAQYSRCSRCNRAVALRQRGRDVRGRFLLRRQLAVPRVDVSASPGAPRTRRAPPGAPKPFQRRRTDHVMVHATHTGAHQVVDLGGGTGNFTRLLAARAPSCVCHTS